MLILRCSAALLLLGSAFAQDRIITTAAGTDWLFPLTPPPAVEAPLGPVYLPAFDAQGSLLIPDPGNHMVFALDARGRMRIVAGNGLSGFSGENGPAQEASLTSPVSVAVGPDGSIFIADLDGHRVVRVRNGILTTVAGTGRPGSAPEGARARVALNRPFGLAVDRDGSLYVAETGNHKIRRIAPDGVITTFAGTGLAGFNGDSDATGSQFNEPTGLALGPDGALYVADTGNNRVRIVQAGAVRTYASSLARPRGVFVDSAGAVLIANTDANEVLRGDARGALIRVAGVGAAGISPLNATDNVPATEFVLGAPRGVVAAQDGTLYIADTNRGRIRKVGSDGILVTAAGNGLFRAPVVPEAAFAHFNSPAGVAFDNSGNMFVADTGGHRIWRIAPDGSLLDYAGTGQNGSGRDNSISSSRRASRYNLSGPKSVATDLSGNVWVADTNNSRLLIVWTDSSMEPGFIGGEWLRRPEAILWNGRNGFYVANTGSGCIQELIVSGFDVSLRDVVGICGRPGAPSDGTPALQFQMRSPSALTLNSSGELYFADRESHSVFRMGRDGTVVRVAGTGEAGSSGDGRDARAARLSSPAGLHVDSAGMLYISDTGNHAVRTVSPSGMITTYAGQPGSPFFAGDGGQPSTASLNLPAGLTGGPGGALYIADSGNDRIRVIAAPTQAVITSSEGRVSFETFVPLSDSRAIQMRSSVPGIPFTTEIVQPSNAQVEVTPSSGVLPAVLRISASGTRPFQQSEGLLRIRPLTRSIPAREVQLTVRTLGPVTPPGPRLEWVSPEETTITVTEGAARRTFFAEVGGISSITAVEFRRGEGWASANLADGRLELTIDPGQLEAAVYQATVFLLTTQTRQTLTFRITLVVNARPREMFLTNTVLSFVSRRGAPPSAQRFAIGNRAGGPMPWSVGSLGAGALPNWLELDATSGTAGTGSADASPVAVTVDPGQLTPGEYRHELRVSAPSAPNAPQIVVVNLVVLGEDQDVDPVIEPASLIFVGLTAGDPPGGQAVRITNLSARPLDFRSSADTGSVRTWFITAPPSGRVAPGQTARVVVQPSQAGLAPSAYSGRLNLEFSSGGRNVGVTAVPVTMVILDAARSASSRNDIRAAIEECSPRDILLGFATLNTAAAGLLRFPPQLRVRAIDNCGNTIRTGSVQASVGTTTAILNFQPVDELWSATLFGIDSSATELRVRIDAASDGMKGALEQVFPANPDPRSPSIRNPGIVNTAQPTPGLPLAPGSLLTINGRNLLEGQPLTASGPWPEDLGGTTVILAGQRVQLKYVAPEVAQGVVPFGLNPDTSHQLVIQRGLRSVAQFVLVARAQPVVLPATTDPASKRMFVVVDDTEVAVSADRPVRAGETVAIYCTGLGDIQSNGAPMPAVAASLELSDQTVALEGVAARLVEGEPGVYRMTGTVPAWVPESAQARVRVRSAGYASDPVAMPLGPQ